MKAEASNNTFTGYTNHGAVAILFALVHIGDMHLHNGTRQRADAISQCNTRMRLGTRIESHAVCTISESVL